MIYLEDAPVFQAPLVSMLYFTLLHCDAFIVGMLLM